MRKLQALARERE